MKKIDRHAMLEDIMIDYGDELVRLAFSYVKDVETAKDLTQNAFIKCFEHIDSFRREAHIKTWLYRIVINECKDYLKSWHYRKVMVRDFLEETTVALMPSVEKTIIDKSASDEMLDAIFSLPKLYREVVYLYYYETLKIGEIAHLLEVSENTVKTRLRRARKKLKPLLSEVGFNEK